jgi:excisionase family DNA binding protein
MTSDRQSGPGNAPRPTQILDPKWDGRFTFTVEEAGEICGISRPSAYAAAKNGTLPTVRIGRRYIVPATRWSACLAPPDKKNPARCDGGRASGEKLNHPHCIPAHRRAASPSLGTHQ